MNEYQNWCFMKHNIRSFWCIQLCLCIKLRLLHFFIADEMTDIRFPCIYCGKELSSSCLVRNSISEVLFVSSGGVRCGACEHVILGFSDFHSYISMLI